MNIFDLERIDPSIFKVFADLQIVANKRRDIDKQIFIDPDQRQRHINSLKTSVTLSTLINHDFSLVCEWKTSL